MQQLLFMIAATGLGVFGSLAVTPFLGLAVYYLFAVLRPQFLWGWTLPVDVPWSYYVAMAVIGSVLILRFAVIIAPERNRDFRSSPFTIGHYGMVFFAVWIAMTYFMAINQVVAYPYFEEYVKLFVMYFVAYLVVSTIRQIWVLYLIVTLALGYIAYEVNAIYFFQGGYMYVYQRGYCGLDNNGAALMLAMGVPMCLFAWDGIRHWSRWGFLLLIPLLIHAVLTSFSRGAMLSLILSIPVYLARTQHRGQLLIILAMMAAMVPFLAGKEIQDRFLTINKSDQDASAQSRLTSWRIAWEMAKERPVFGYGIRNSPLFTFEKGADMEGRVIHSQYLQIAADSGIIGMLTYLLCIALFLYCLEQVRRQYRCHVSLLSNVLALCHLLISGRWNPHPSNGPRDDAEIRLAYAMAGGLEGAMIVFGIGAIFLSLETFELPYLLLFLGVQLWGVCLLDARSKSPVVGRGMPGILKSSLGPM